MFNFYFLMVYVAGIGYVLPILGNEEVLKEQDEEHKSKAEIWAERIGSDLKKLPLLVMRCKD